LLSGIAENPLASGVGRCYKKSIPATTDNQAGGMIDNEL
jgi:hypothetical protein